MEKFSYFKSKLEYNVSKMNHENDNDFYFRKNKKHDDEETPYKFEIYNEDNYVFFNKYNKLKPDKLFDGKIDIE